MCHVYLSHPASTTHLSEILFPVKVNSKQQYTCDADTGICQASNKLASKQAVSPPFVVNRMHTVCKSLLLSAAHTDPTQHYLNLHVKYSWLLFIAEKKPRWDVEHADVGASNIRCVVPCGVGGDLRGYFKNEGACRLTETERGLLISGLFSPPFSSGWVFTGVDAHISEL